MKIRIMLDFTYNEKVAKEFEDFAKENNLPIEEVVRQGMQNLLDDCYMCVDGESYEVSAAKLLEE